MTLSQHTDALARVYAAGIAASVEMEKMGNPMADGGLFARVCVHDFVQWLRHLEDEERDRLGVTAA